MKTSDKYSYFMKNNETVVNCMGIMSGTSLDGLDIALIRTNAMDKFELKQFYTYEYNKSLKQSINNFIQNRISIKFVSKLITEFNVKAPPAFSKKTRFPSKGHSSIWANFCLTFLRRSGLSCSIFL